MNNFMFRIAQFMRGRRGWDHFNFFLFIASFIIEIIGNLFRIRIIYYIGFAMFLWAIFRMMSRNIYKREQENMRFLRVWNGLRGGRRPRGYSGGAGNTGGANYNQGKKYKKTVKADSTIYCNYYCPTCKQQVRIPAGKGKVNITCPRCGEKFEAHS